MIENRALWGYQGEARGRGESEGRDKCTKHIGIVYLPCFRNILA